MMTTPTITTAAQAMDQALARLHTPVAQLLPTDTLLGVLERRVDQTRHDVDHAAQYLAEHITENPYLSEVEEFELAVWVGRLQARHEEAKQALREARQALGLAA
jgi:hypothetical protein